MDMLHIDAKVGEARCLQLGNARFSHAEINGGIGELEVDFSGEILPDCKAKVDLDIGEATVILPRHAGVKMQIGGILSILSHKNIDNAFYKRGKSYYSEGYEDKLTTWNLRVSPGLGELNVEQE
jgi:hypothetical protein